MDKLSMNGNGTELARYETPFTDVTISREQPEEEISVDSLLSDFYQQAESPFSRSYDAASVTNSMTPAGEEFVNFLSELHDAEFTETLYAMADEVEDTWRNKVSNEIEMGSNYVPFASQQARNYFTPILNETDSMIDRVSQHFSGNNFADYSEIQIDNFFNSLEHNQDNYTPVQDQFWNKIKSAVKGVVKKGVDLAKKGISVVGKFLPMDLVLAKLKGLVRPLLDKVLKFALGKLPKNLQPYAQSLAKKFLKMETADETGYDLSQSENDLEAIQTEFNSSVAELVFSQEETNADNLTMDFEASYDNLERVDNYDRGYADTPSLDAAREKFINELKSLQPGESAAPAIERFLPVAIMALKPVIKIALSLVGRQKIINFLAGLLAKLISKFVPANVVKPLAASIIDMGLTTIGFEVHETDKPDVGYEAIANTVQDTIQNMTSLDEATLNNTDELSMNLLAAFEQAAANNFPPQYIREPLRQTHHKATWVAMPRNMPVKFYKKFTHVYDVTIDPQTASTVTTFRNLPLANFLKDKYGLETSAPVKARVHLYEMSKGGRLSIISKFEKLPGLNAKQPRGWVQLLPLTKQAATLLLKEPALGKDAMQAQLATRFKAIAGQRYYYLEIEGARLRMPPVNRSQQKPGDNKLPVPVTESRSADVQAVINFIKSEIKLNYYFSEEDAKGVVGRLNSNDFLGAAITIRQSIKTVLQDMLLKNIQSKVKIVHEAVPEGYLENIGDQQQFAPLDILGKVAGKEIISKLVGQVIEKIAGKAYDSVAGFFKARAAEFKEAQAQPQDGVTIKLTWSNVAGMSAIRTVINAIRGNLSIGNLSGLTMPSFSAPDIKIEADKRFD
jgi:hypothetical protein